MDKENIISALATLRKNEKRKFNQTVDLIINLRNFDAKKQSINVVAEMPYKAKDKKICAFLNKNSSLVDTITKPEFDNYKDKKQLKQLVKKYDFFMAIGALMPSVATTFGKVLGPSGKMPSPQLGMLAEETDNAIKAMLEKINKSIKVKTKDPALRIAVGKESMKDEEIAENIMAIYNAVYKVLPRTKENLRSILIKFTMTKPVKLAL
jgi:large subunit ribosomal protein L1